jgi:3-dehydroquinate synthase
MRGINFIQIPTTLLAQVDSSVGGKTAVNHPLGKNMIGVFYQPKLVLADVATLKTLPERELLSGIAEVIKYGLIKDTKFYSYLQRALSNGLYHQKKGLVLSPLTLIEIITACCRMKAWVVEKDEKETGLRAILNFGHTVGHAIEALTKYKKYTHGEAVALGMIAALEISLKKRFIEQTELAKILKIYQKINLPQKLKSRLDPQDIIKTMYHDKKVAKENIRMILLKKIGEATIETIRNESIIIQALKKISGEVF